MDIPLPGEIPLPGDHIPLPASPPPLPGPDTEFSAVSTRGFSVGFPFANPAAKQQQPLPPAFPPPSDDVDVLFQPPTHKETAVAAAAALYSPSRVSTCLYGSMTFWYGSMTFWYGSGSADPCLSDKWIRILLFSSF
jgi:hypothetical protein